MSGKIYKGPDISSHNGDVDFTKIKGKYDFVILRCGYGSDFEYQDDVKFLRNAEECERLGIPYGVYLYSYATDKKKAASEAQHVLRLIEGRKISCGVWYDVEDKCLPQNKDELTENCICFLEAIEGAGYYAGIYASLNFFNTRLDLERLSPYDKWVAQWNKTDDFTEKHGMWQFSSTEKIDGLTGDFDMNIAYYDYPAVTDNMNKKAEPFYVKVKAKGGLNIRTGPGVRYKISGAYKDGEAVKILSTENGWGKTEKGYISMNYTEVFTEGGVYLVTADKLNVRKGAGTGYDILTALSKGDEIKAEGIENGFVKFTLTLEGYAKADYLSKKE